MCDFVHALLLGRLERAWLAERTAAGVASVFVEGEVDLPPLEEALAVFDAALLSDPQEAAVLSEEQEWLVAMGLR